MIKALFRSILSAIGYRIGRYLVTLLTEQATVANKRIDRDAWRDRHYAEYGQHADKHYH